jgi:hypothetical protein
MMILSSVFLGLTGISLAFFPLNIIQISGVEYNLLDALGLQLSGSIFPGFAYINLVSCKVAVKNQNGRHLIVANYVHFTIASIVLFRFAMTGFASFFIWILAVVYLGFVFLFGFTIFFRHENKFITRN